VQLAPGQHGLEQVARVHAALGLSGAHNSVQFVDEEDDLPLGLAHLLQNSLQPLFKLAAVLGARDQTAHVQGKDGLFPQTVGHVAPDDALGKSLRDGGLAHARLADQHRIVFRLAGENADHVADLRVPADHRVQLLPARPLHQIGAVLLQRVIGILGIVGGHRIRLDLGQFLRKAAAGDPVILKQGLDAGASLREKAQHQMLHGQILVAELVRHLLSKTEHRRRLRGGVNLSAAAGNLGLTVHKALQLLQQRLAVHTHPAEQGADQAVLLVHQSIEQMLRRQILVLPLLRQFLRGVQRLRRLLRIFVSVPHLNSFLSSVLFKTGSRARPDRPYKPAPHPPGSGRPDCP